MPVMEDLGFIHYFRPASTYRKSLASELTLLLLHGTGGNESSLLGLADELTSRASVLSPRGKSLDEGVARYFRRLAEGIFDIEDLKSRTCELADFVVAAADKYGLAGSKFVAAGYSNGANVAASLLLLRPEVLAGAILFRAVIPLVPITLPDLSGKPVFIAEGKRDPIISQEQSEELTRLLERCGAQVTLHWKNNGTHSLGEDEVKAAKEWFRKHFHEDESPKIS